MIDNIEDKLFKRIYSFRNDPAGFVKYAFPWREPGTLLADEDGPDTWQLNVFNDIADGPLPGDTAVQIAAASGHGVGKSTLAAWVILWFISTRGHPQIVITANTKTQLVSKTWRELAKWHKLAINAHWFEWTATKFYAKESPETWFAQAIPWSEHKSEAFAGTHERHVLIIFDESSAIPDIIWEVASGAMTTAGAYWLVFGNPTRNTGRFKECFNKERNRWKTHQVDSMSAKMTKKEKLQQWINDYGEDSDFVRVRVRGLFPRASSMQFIGEDIVSAAVNRQYNVSVYRDMPIIMGVDVARFGDDQSVIYIRQGLQTIGIKKYRELDTMQLASQVARTQDEYRAKVVFVDEVGIGAGVVDRLRHIGREVIGVNGGNKAATPKHYNHRAEIWDDMRTWLKNGGSIPDDPELISDLTGPEYGYTPSEALQLEKKTDMKERGLASPDIADALACTFSLPVTVVDRDQQVQEEYERSKRDMARDKTTGY